MNCRLRILSLLLALFVCAAALPVAGNAETDYVLLECEELLSPDQSAYASAKEAEGASGGKTVGPIGMNGAAWFTITGVIAPADGDYLAEVVYTSCADGRTFRVGVGEAEGGLVQAPALAGWTDFGVASVTLSLKAGENTLRFYSVDAAQGLGDSEWGPDVDCIRLYVTQQTDDRTQRIESIIALIDDIGEVTQDNYADALALIQSAEQALATLVEQYGEAVSGEVTNLDHLLQARAQYDTYHYIALLPPLTDGYRQYECEADTSVLASSSILSQETASGGKTVGPIGQNGQSSCLMQGIIVPEDGVYLLEVVYTATVEINGRTFRVGINGQPGDLVIAPGLESPNSLGIVVIPVELRAGANQLLFYGMDAALNLGDGMWGPDLDCIRIYEDKSLAYSRSVEEVVGLIDSIGEVNEETYPQCLAGILAAEAAMTRLEGLYGEGIRAEVANYDLLLTAREDYEFYSQPIGRDGYLIYECENLHYTKLNGAGTGVSLSGAGVVNTLVPDAATSFTMSIESEKAGWYDCQIGYFNGESEPRACCLQINGKSMEILYASSGGWDMSASITLAAELREGVNTFTFVTSRGSEGFGPDFDYLGISELPIENPVMEGERIGAQSAAISGALTLTDNAFAYDGKAITGFETTGDKAAFSFTVASDGFYRIGVEASSADTSTRTLSLALKGSQGDIPSLMLDGGYSLGIFTWLSTGIELTAGEYTLEIACPVSGGQSPRIALSSLVLHELTGEQLQRYRANEIRSQMESIGLINIGNYADKEPIVTAIDAALKAYDAEYGREGAVLIPEASRKTLSDALETCLRLAEAKEQAAPVMEAIAEIGDITKENYKDRRVALEAAEQAMENYLDTYGRDCKGFVENYDVLTQARKDYDAFDQADVYTLGDIDGNGTINATDALLALQHSVELISLGETQRLAADVNRDGDINATDALLILQHSVKIITAFPQNS